MSPTDYQLCAFFTPAKDARTRQCDMRDRRQWAGQPLTKVWDAANGQRRFTISGHGSWIHDVAFSPDGQWLATASADETIKLWNAATGENILTLPCRPMAHTVTFSPDAEWIVAGHRDGTLRVWEASTGNEVRAVRGHTDAIKRVAFSPDGRRLVSASKDESVKLWDIVAGRELLTLCGSEGPVNSVTIAPEEFVNGVAFSPGGRLIAAGSEDGAVRIWKAADWTETSWFGHRGTSVHHIPTRRSRSNHAWPQPILSCSWHHCVLSS